MAGKEREKGEGKRVRTIGYQGGSLTVKATRWARLHKLGVGDKYEDWIFEGAGVRVPKSGDLVISASKARKRKAKPAGSAKEAFA